MIEAKPAMTSLPKYQIVKRSNSRWLACYTSVLDGSELEAMTPGWKDCANGRDVVFSSGQSVGISDLSGLW